MYGLLQITFVIKSFLNDGRYYMLVPPLYLWQDMVTRNCEVGGSYGHGWVDANFAAGEMA